MIKRTFNLKGKDATLDNIRGIVSDQQIYEFYFKEKIYPGKKYISPFRDTTTHNFTFLSIGVNELLWRDWGDESQDKPLGIVSFVCKKYNCSYINALSIINKDLGLGLDGIGVTPTSSKKTIDIPKRREMPEKKHKIIEVETQPFTSEDIRYWGSHGIELRQLVKFCVNSAKYVWIDDMLVRIYSKSTPVYSYKLGKEDEKNFYKIYSPFSEKRRKWLTNANNHIIQGLDQLTWTDYKLIITKSLKDVMLIDQMGFDAIALQSETSPMPGYLSAMLESAYDEIFVLFDNDPVGIKNSKNLCAKHGYSYIEIPDKYGQKDLSDFVRSHGYLTAENVLNKLVGEAIVTRQLEGLPF